MEAERTITEAEQSGPKHGQSSRPSPSGDAAIGRVAAFSRGIGGDLLPWCRDSGEATLATLWNQARAAGDEAGCCLRGPGPQSHSEARVAGSAGVGGWARPALRMPGRVSRRPGAADLRLPAEAARRPQAVPAGRARHRVLRGGQVGALTHPAEWGSLRLVDRPCHHCGLGGRGQPNDLTAGQIDLKAAGYFAATERVPLKTTPLHLRTPFRQQTPAQWSG